MAKYIYPKFNAFKHLGFVRIGGCGLANCLYTYARAITQARETGAKIITPTWFNISIGTYLRKDADKRHYLGLFSSEGEVSGISKYLKLLFCRKDIETVEGLGGYFTPILNDAEYVSNYIESHVNQSLLGDVNAYDFTDCVAVHVRLGDFPDSVRVPMSWYKERILEMKMTNENLRFLIFSDGRDEELSDLLEVESVKRVFFGNAIADIFAISRCCYLIGSHSTFSGWGAYLGQVPCRFHKKTYGPILKDQTKEIIDFR